MTTGSSVEFTRRLEFSSLLNNISNNNANANANAKAPSSFLRAENNPNVHLEFREHESFSLRMLQGRKKFGLFILRHDSISCHRGGVCWFMKNVSLHLSCLKLCFGVS